jgi:hypothetical protein
VWLWPDPAGEAVGEQRVGVEVELHRGLVDDAIVIVGGQRFTGFGVLEIGVRDVPLAVVVGVVARFLEPVAERRHFAGAQPTQPGIVVPLTDAVGLGDPVQIGILTGEDRRPARHARERTRVVPREADAMLVEPAPTAEGPASPGQHVGRFVRWHRAFLVCHEDDDVRSISHAGAPFVGPSR